MKSLINSVTLSLLLHSGKAIHSKKDVTQMHKDGVDNKDVLLYTNSISSGGKLREIDYSTREQVKAASETA
jgi:hypothetical protein